MTETLTAYRTCPLCEATCGLELTLEDGDDHARSGATREDVFSHGFICPKGFALKALHEDPDRVRTPLIRTRVRLRGGLLGRGVRRDRPPPRRRSSSEHGRDAVAVYLGNPNAHNLDALLYGRVLREGARHAQRLLGHHRRPDAEARVRRADVRHGAQHPGARPRPHRLPADARRQPARLERQPADRARHARPPARDPRARRQGRRGRPAPQPHRRGCRRAPLHPARAPTRTSCSRIVNVLFDEGLADLGALAEHVRRPRGGRASWRASSRPRRVADACGIDAGEIRRIARELAGAERAAVYGRIGTCTQEFGTLASWLVDVLNVLTGNLDRPGGAMFTKAAAGSPNTRGTPGQGKGVQLGRWQSRVRGLPEVFGELPVACLAEEIETPGDGQVRALFTLAGNPVREHAERRPPAPGARGPRADGERRHLRQRDHAPRRRDPARALGALPLALRPRALPARGPQRRELLAAGARPRRLGRCREWQTLLRLAGIAAGQGPDADVEALDDFVIGGARARGSSRTRPRRSPAATPRS